MDIYVNMKHEHVDEGVLGPYARYGLWVSGCNKNCAGCISPESRNMHNGKKYQVNTLAWDIISSPGIEGVTISGGEPFLQAQALCELVETVKKHRDIGVIIYTGYLYEELAELPYGEKLCKLSDMIIDGEYKKEFDDGKALRGSSNQRVIPVTDRYKSHLSMYGEETRKTQTDYSRNCEVKHMGIPTNSKY